MQFQSTTSIKTARTHWGSHRVPAGSWALHHLVLVILSLASVAWIVVSGQSVAVSVNPQTLAAAVVESVPINDQNQTNDNKNPIQKWLDGVVGKARETIDATLNPKRDWFKLIKRYHDWFSKYKSIYDEAGRVPDNKQAGGLKGAIMMLKQVRGKNRETDQADESAPNRLLAPMDLLAAEFARTDHKLFPQLLEEENQQASSSSTQAPGTGGEAAAATTTTTISPVQRQKSLENFDYLYDVLDTLMQGLESSSDDVDLIAERQRQQLEQLLVVVAGATTNDDRVNSKLVGDQLRSTPEFREAIERVKRIALNTAEGVAKNEAMTLVRMAFVNVLLAGVTNLAGANDSGQFNELCAIVLGATGHEMVIQYLADLNRRAVLGLLQVWNPIKRVRESLNKD